MKTLYLVTGAKGHLASTIIRALRGKECLIRGFILPTEKAEDDLRVTYYHGDVTNEHSMDAFFSNAECYEVIVIHAAGIISIDSKPSVNMREVNVIGTQNVIDECRKHRVKRLVYVSSVHAIRENGDQVICEATEFSPESVHGAYAKTKAEASQLVLEADRCGLDTIIVHPSGIIGPYDDGRNHMVQMIQMALKHKLPAGVTGGYDFVDVRDVALGCIAAAEIGQKGRCYILSNCYITVRELLDMVADKGGTAKLLSVPLPLAKMAAPFAEFYARCTHQRPLFTPYALETLSLKGRFSHDRATSELGYHPRPIEDTVVDTITYLRRLPCEYQEEQA